MHKSFNHSPVCLHTPKFLLDLRLTSRAALLGLSLILLWSCSTTEIETPQPAGEESTAPALDELIGQIEDGELNRSSLEALLDTLEPLLTGQEISSPTSEPSNNATDSERLELSIALSELSDIGLGNAEQRARLALLQAQAEINLNRSERALAQLQAMPAWSVEDMPDLFVRRQRLTAQLLMGRGEPVAAFQALQGLSALVPPGERQLLHDLIWQALDSLDAAGLRDLAAGADSYELRGWIELSRTLRGTQLTLRDQLDSVDQWRRVWNRHPALALLPTPIERLTQHWSQRPRHIALILPLQQAAGIAIQEGFLSAYYQALTTNGDVPRLTLIDSSGAQSILPLYQQAVDAGVDLVVGPLDKGLVTQLYQQRELPVTTLALNYAEAVGDGPANLYQYGLAPEDEIARTTELASRMGYRHAALLTPDTDEYRDLQDTFTGYWHQQGGEVVARTGFSGSADYAEVIQSLLAIDASEARAARLISLLPRSDVVFVPRRRQDVDFLFLIANPLQGRQIKPTLAFYFAGDLPVFALPSINDGLDNPGADLDLDGIVFPDYPWILNSPDALKESVSRSLRPVQGPLQRLRAMGIDSFILHTRLGQLSSGEQRFLPGVTGRLSLSADGEVRRELDFASFINGRVELFTPTLNAGL